MLQSSISSLFSAMQHFLCATALHGDSGIDRPSKRKWRAVEARHSSSPTGRRNLAMEPQIRYLPTPAPMQCAAGAVLTRCRPNFPFAPRISVIPWKRG